MWIQLLILELVPSKFLKNYFMTLHVYNLTLICKYKPIPRQPFDRMPVVSPDRPQPTDINFGRVPYSPKLGFHVLKRHLLSSGLFFSIPLRLPLVQSWSNYHTSKQLQDGLGW